MIQLNNLKMLMNLRPLFEGLSWKINERSRVGLVGDNGTGKTTLFRVILGLVEPDGGNVEIPKGKRFGYLPQDLVELENIGLIVFLKERAGVSELERLMHDHEDEVSRLSSAGAESESILKKHDEVSARYRALGGYDFEARAKKVLRGLGFRERDLSKKCAEFSGGWKMRILLASILLSSTDILLLDEPTNHLDTESMEWLEGWLSGYEGTIVTISHDRRFLDKMTNQTAELSSRKITLYKGNYSYYLEEKEKRAELREKEREGQKAEVERITSFIDRFRYKASKAVQVQSRVKMLEKFDLIEEDRASRRVKIRFPECPRSGHEVVAVQNLRKSYGDLEVLHDINFVITRGERVALVGVNGAGKSTMSRLLGKVELPSQGEVRHGLNVKTAFFSQESSINLDYSNSVWEEVAFSSLISDQEKRNLLGSFLFSGDDIRKNVSVLSGGEKSRLALLKILLQNSNLLILDEPTNHLDATTRELFQEALLQYGGTLVIVSHDRHFLDDLVERIIEIRDGGIFDYHGNYSYFIEKRGELQKEIEYSECDKPKQTVSQDKERRREEAERRNRIFRLKKEIMDELTPIESRISELENFQAQTEIMLCDPDILVDSSRIKSLMIDRQAAISELDSLMAPWEKLMEKLDAVEKI